MVSGTLSLPCPGCFSPFPHGTGSLSVSREYLALPDGPGGFAQDSTCPALLRVRAGRARAYVNGAVTRYGRTFQSVTLRSCAAWRPPYNPPACRNMRGLGSSPVARRYWGNHSYFLFLRVLRCFSSPRWPPGMRRDNAPSGHWVVPFGDPRVNGHLRLTAAFRSLSRPSSPPRAKASAMRPSVLPSPSLHKREGSVSRLRFLFFSFCHCRNMS